MNDDGGDGSDLTATEMWRRWPILLPTGLEQTPFHAMSAMDFLDGWIDWRNARILTRERSAALLMTGAVTVATA
jgi:hypothetical protein